MYPHLNLLLRFKLQSTDTILLDQFSAISFLMIIYPDLKEVAKYGSKR
jgi:hypothetical protein